MTPLLPAPPNAALETVLQGLDRTGLHFTLTVERTETSNRAGGGVAYITSSRYASREPCESLFPWAREAISAFAPLHLLHMYVIFASTPDLPYAAPASAAGKRRPALLPLARRVADDWAEIARGRETVKVQANLVRSSRTGSLTRVLCAYSSDGLIPMGSEDCELSWQTAFAPWLDGVERLHLTFLWRRRPTAHFLAELAAAEAST